MLEHSIRTIPDHPKPGILFRDITTLLGDPTAFGAAVDALVAPYREGPVAKVAGIEARGFILGGAVAHRLGAGFVPVRKRGKLPHETVRIAYALEYGSDEIEVHRDAVAPGERVLLVDDLIATGGTAVAAVELLRSIGAEVVAAAFVIDLPDLGGAARLRDMGLPVQTLVAFPGH
ncbi:MAG: adenine phosphoribosyltransferase [Gammaproteobacteria bacterium]|jgi:adenine phosphoribosyltransferase